MTSLRPKCSASAGQYASNILFEPKSEDCQVAQSIHAALFTFAGVCSWIDPQLGAGAMAFAHIPKVIRNMHCYNQTFFKALSGNTNEGLLALTTNFASAVLPSKYLRVTTALAGLFTIGEEVAQMKQQESSKVVRLIKMSKEENQTQVETQLGQMKIYSPNSNTDCNPLFIAAKYLSPSLARSLGKVEGSCTNPRDELGNSPLHLVSGKNDVETAKVFLQRDSQAPLSKNKEGNTPLSIAVSKGLVRMAELLVEAGSDVNFTYKNGVSLAHTCYSQDSLEMFKAVAQGKNFNVNVQNKFGQTLLHRATRDQRSDWLYQLNLLGADATIEDFDGNVAK